MILLTSRVNRRRNGGNLVNRLRKHDRTTRGIKNCRDSWLFRGCSPLQLLCNLTGNRPQSATFHTAIVIGHNNRQIHRHMQNLTHPLLICYAVIWLIEFFLFGLQRTTLKISRQSNVEYRGIGERLLPSWYPVTWLVRLAKYGLLIAMFIIIDWKIALFVLVIGFVLSSIIPIPYRFLYKSILQKRIRKIMRMDYEVGKFYQNMLDSSNL